jgi:signal transduction histidine kinase
VQASNLQQEDIDYLKQNTLQATIYVSFGVVMVVAAMAAFVFVERGRFQAALLWIVVAGLLLLGTGLSRIFAQREQIDVAAIFLIGSYLLAISFSLTGPGAVDSYLPYFAMLVIVLGGLILSPQAAFATALTAILLNLSLVSMTQGFNRPILFSLVPSSSLYLLTASVTWLGASNMLTAFQWAVQSQQKATRRRNEIFEKQQELERTYAALEATNRRLSLAQRKLEERAAELAELNLQLVESQEELKRINASKDKFFSIIAHDLKNPLHAVMGFSEFLTLSVDTMGREDIEEIAQTIHKSANNVYQLMENLLEWARIQTGRMPFLPEPIPVLKLADDTVELLMGNAIHKGIILSTHVHHDLHIVADANMMSSVLQNLVTNALKFTHEGGQVSITAEENDEGVRVSVSDTGVGMPPEVQEKLFRIDTHHSTAGTAQEEGTGLGLILCRELVEKNEGKIWVESEMGVGTSIIMQFPPVMISETEVEAIATP